MDADKWLGVIAISATPDMCVVEIDGEPLISYQPWHFDHCYNDELNQAGVLRAAIIPPEGGRTLYSGRDPDLPRPCRLMCGPSSRT